MDQDVCAFRVVTLLLYETLVCYRTHIYYVLPSSVAGFVTTTTAADETLHPYAGADRRGQAIVGDDDSPTNGDFADVSSRLQRAPSGSIRYPKRHVTISFDEVTSVVPSRNHGRTHKSATVSAGNTTSQSRIESRVAKVGPTSNGRRPVAASEGVHSRRSRKIGTSTSKSASRQLAQVDEGATGDSTFGYQKGTSPRRSAVSSSTIGNLVGNRPRRQAKHSAGYPYIRSSGPPRPLQSTRNNTNNRGFYLSDQLYSSIDSGDNSLSDADDSTGK